MRYGWEGNPGTSHASRLMTADEHPANTSRGAWHMTLSLVLGAIV